MAAPIYRRNHSGGNTEYNEPRRTLNGMLLPTKVFLGGLAPETTKDQVLIALRKYGKPLDANIITDRSMFSKNGEQRRFAFVEFATEKEVEAMLNTFLRRHLEIDGRRLNLNKAYRKASTFGKVFGPGAKKDDTGKEMKAPNTLGLGMGAGGQGGFPLAHNGGQGWLPYQQPLYNPYQGQAVYPQYWQYNYATNALAGQLPYGYGVPLGMKGGSSGTPSPTGSSTASSGVYSVMMGSPPRDNGGLMQPAYGGSPPHVPAPYGQGWMGGQLPLEQYQQYWPAGQQYNTAMYPVNAGAGLMYNGNMPVFAPQGPAMDGSQMYPPFNQSFSQ